MSNLSEEELIKFIEKFLQDNIDSPYGLDLGHIQAIQGLLDLYNKEKNKCKQCDINMNNQELLKELNKEKEKNEELEGHFAHFVNDFMNYNYIHKDKIKKEFEKFTAHNNCFNLGDIQLLLDNILEEE